MNMTKEELIVENAKLNRILARYEKIHAPREETPYHYIYKGKNRTWGVPSN